MISSREGTVRSVTDHVHVGDGVRGVEVPALPDGGEEMQRWIEKSAKPERGAAGESTALANDHRSPPDRAAFHPTGPAARAEEQ